MSERQNDLRKQLLSRKGWFAEMIADSEKYEIRIIYSQIDRDSLGEAHFNTVRLGAGDDDYFYPASTVKLPVALFALEKINSLGIPGLDKYTAVQFDSLFPGQPALYQDSTAPDGRVSIAHLIKKVLLVSDNDAFNRLYDFVGPQDIHNRLRELSLNNTRITHRLSLTLVPAENRRTAPLQFVSNEKIIYRQGILESPEFSYAALRNELRGRGYIRDEALVEKPMDFSRKNYFSASDMHELLKELYFPGKSALTGALRLKEDDYRFLWKYMGLRPAESDIKAFHSAQYYDSYVKFLMFGNSRAPIPERFRLFNKVGDAYGFMIDNAYFVDFESGVEFLLTAVVEVNQNQIYNDGKYEYEELGLPFMSALGKLVYENELTRKRRFKPDLTALQNLFQND